MSEAIKNKLGLLLIILALTCLPQANCDLPVHCMPKDIKGTWQLFLEDKPLTTK